MVLKEGILKKICEFFLNVLKKIRKIFVKEPINTIPTKKVIVTPTKENGCDKMDAPIMIDCVGLPGVRPLGKLMLTIERACKNYEGELQLTMIMSNSDGAEGIQYWCERFEAVCSDPSATTYGEYIDEVGRDWEDEKQRRVLAGKAKQDYYIHPDTALYIIPIAFQCNGGILE